MESFCVDSLIKELETIPRTKEDSRGTRFRVTMDGYVSIFDITVHITGWSSNSARKAIHNVLKKHPTLPIEYRTFSGQGQKPTPTIAITNLSQLMEVLIPGAKMPIKKKKMLLGQNIPIRMYMEIEIHDCLMKTFSDEKMILQYPVKKYRIDLYIVDHNVAIECDEYNHASYGKLKEEERTSTISNILKCRWIRYDPYSKDFNIFRLIDTIRIALYKQKD